MTIRTIPRHTLRAAADALGISYAHMRRLATDAGLRGRGIRVSDADIEAWRTRKTKPGPKAKQSR